MDLVTLAATILVAGMVVLLALGVPIAISVGLPALAATVVILGWDGAVLATSQRMFTGINNFSLLAIPFFVFAGVLMNNGGIASRLVDAAQVVSGRLPASLAQTTVVANTMFGAVSGAAVASAAAVGTVMTPRMAEKGYDRPWAAAVNVAAAPAGMLIPPSNTFIVYALVSGASISALFMAGVGPGIVWALACMVVVALYARKHPELRSTERPTFVQGLLVLWRAVPSMLMIVVVVGGMLSGIFTATESSAIAVVYCLVLCAIYRTIRLRDLPKALLEASRTTAIVMLLVGVSSALSWVMSFTRMPELMADAMLSISDEPVVILLIIMVLLLIIGLPMDPTPAILIFTPILLPIVVEIGIHPVHFGAMMVFNLALGNITPPVGNVLFVGARVSRVRIEAVTHRLTWFFVALLIGLFVVVFVPQLSMWLPTALGLVAP